MQAGLSADGAGLPPLPLRRLTSLLAVHSPIRRGAGLLQQVLPQGLLPLSWGCGQEPRHEGSGPQPPAHVSAGEESAREPTSVTHSQGTHRDSLWLSGAADSSQGPWEPGVLRAALSLGGKATAEGALLLPFASL